MNYIPKSSPARLTEPATRKLPRKALVFAIFLYTFFGLFYREPWKTPDLVGLSTMIHVAEHNFSDLMPQVGGLLYPNEGLITAWIGAIFIKVFSPFIALFTQADEAIIIAARLANFLYITLILYGVWYGTYLLSRRKECQPIALPFGGEPHPRDYGRMLADVAFMFVIATLGIIVPLHETSGFPVTLALVSLCFYGFCRLLDRPYIAFFWLLAGFTGLLLNHEWIACIAVFITSCILMGTPNIYTQPSKASLLMALVISIILSLLVLAYALSTYHPISLSLDQWLQQTLSAIKLDRISDFFSKFRDSFWFYWPIWPFALMALYRWRHYLLSPHIWIPTVFFITAFVLSLVFNDDHKLHSLAFSVIPMASLAAMAIPTLRRNIINAIDWFAIMVISLTLVAIWLGWFALYFGWPTKLHFNIIRLLNGYNLFPSFWALCGSIVVTILWVMLVSWRLKLKPSALWRGLVLSAGGLILSWIMLALLWLPAINYNRSYQEVTLALADVVKQLPQDACINASHIGIGQRAAFEVFAHLRFSENPACTYTLVQTHKRHDALIINTLRQSDKVVWEGARKTDRYEHFMLLHK
ncbi:hypothetical protein IX83_05520 [Basilea psittacipulmonis DSM 24701]|uniref:Glycosyltransferase RgtA/B/C/D-like domain-containing protein n=2 Tax=Basilea TaxID=1472344 RepID=A0A077DFD2_9BURK|nr:hypothetical protein IX83_05520 [Basilea psittacipulmonis DSM 24701]